MYACSRVRKGEGGRAKESICMNRYETLGLNNSKLHFMSDFIRMCKLFRILFSLKTNCQLEKAIKTNSGAKNSKKRLIQLPYSSNSTLFIQHISHCGDFGLKNTPKIYVACDLFLQQNMKL